MNAPDPIAIINATREPATRLYSIRDSAGKLVALIRAQSPSGALSYHAAATLSVSRTTADEAIEATLAGIKAADASAGA
jgi:hypothetical protein